MADCVQSTHSVVRIAAIEALGRVGQADDVATLLATPDIDSKETGEAVLAALTRLQGPGVDESLLQSLTSGDKKTGRIVIESLGRRAYGPAKALLVSSASDTDKQIRLAAVKALGETMSAADTPAMVDLLLKSSDQSDITACEKSLMRIYGRIQPKDIDERELWGSTIIAALPKAGPSVRPALLRAVSSYGGPKSLQAVRSLAESGDTETKDQVFRTLCDWPNAEAADDLLAVIRKASDEKEQVLALQGYLRMAGRWDLATTQRLAMCREGLLLARRDEEKRLVLGTLSDLGTVEALAEVLPYLDHKEVRTEASVAALTIGQRLLPWHAASVADAADKVIKAETDPDLLRRATELRNKAKGNGS